MSQMMNFGFQSLKKSNIIRDRLKFRNQNNRNSFGIPEYSGTTRNLDRNGIRGYVHQIKHWNGMEFKTLV